MRKGLIRQLSKCKCMEPESAWQCVFVTDKSARMGIYLADL